MSECTHHWTVTSECPFCLREELDESERVTEVLRERVMVLENHRIGGDETEIERLREQNKHLREMAISLLIVTVGNREDDEIINDFGMLGLDVVRRMREALGDE